MIAAHVGSTGKNEGQDNMQRTLALMDEFPELSADISALTQINRKRFLDRVLKAPGPYDRLLYGTDLSFDEHDPGISLLLSPPSEMERDAVDC